ncbi:Transcription factor KUA1 [Bienertia sinuspersici]
MTRRCSHCSHNGHNSRTCPNRGVKLFGVRLTDGSIRKSASMGNLSLHQNGVVGNTSPAAGDHTPDHLTPAADGYASEDIVAGSSSSRERKKGVPWTEEEHRMFLLGLQKLGKGDWRGISRNYVISRTPTQVASHAQKYFIRQNNVSRRKRRSSLFDIVADEGGDAPMESHDFLPEHPLDTQTSNDNHPLPPAPTLDEECESMASSNSNSIEADPTPPKPEPSQSSAYPTDTSQNYYPLVYPAYVSPFYPYPVPFWTGSDPEIPEPAKDTHEVVKPTAVHSKSPINVDELVGMSKLSLGETIGSGEPSSLSLKLLDNSSRQSAFHANPAPSSSDMNSGGSPIHAV